MIMNKWIDVLQNPEIIIPAIISALFTLLGAFGGVYLSSKHANKLSRFNRLMSLKEELHEFKLAIAALESHIPNIISIEKLDKLTKINLSSMIKEVKEEELVSKIMSVRKPSTLEYQDFVNLMESLNFLEYCLVESKEDELIFKAFINYKRQINKFKISLKINLKY